MLPIHSIRDQLLATMRRSNRLVLTAPTGGFAADCDVGDVGYEVGGRLFGGGDAGGAWKGVSGGYSISGQAAGEKAGGGEIAIRWLGECAGLGTGGGGGAGCNRGRGE